MTVDFSRNYVPPGVYIDESASTTTTVSGIPPTQVALVGPAQGYQTFSEQVVFSSSAVTLSKQGIDNGHVSVSVAGTGVAVDPADYVLAEVGTTSDQTYQTTLSAAATPTTALGTTLVVTYQYTDPTYFDPKLVENYEDVKDIYGEPLNTTVRDLSDTSYKYVQSPLSLAALLAFQNGASQLWLVPTTPPGSGATTDSAKSTARRSAIASALARLETNNEVSVIVPITDGILTADAPGALIDLRTSMNNGFNEGFPRMGIIGFDAGVSTAPDTLVASAPSLRVMLAYSGPGGLSMYSGAANSVFTVGHQYLAAAYAGRMAALPVQYSLTKQVIAGFSGLAGTPLSNSLKNQYSRSGVAVTEVDRLRRLVVRHGVTTDMTNVNTREAAVVRAKDTMMSALSNGMDSSGLIGSPIDENTLLNVKSAVQGILETVNASGAIFSYANLMVRQTSTDPSVIEVKFSYRPSYPLNYITISFSIDMTTGSTTTNDINTDSTVA